MDTFQINKALGMNVLNVLICGNFSFGKGYAIKTGQ
jgi:hypothetical protein